MIQVTKASNKKSEGLTIRTSQLSNKFKFKDGNQYIVLFGDDTPVLFNVSRNGETLYANKKAAGDFNSLPKIGKPAFLPIRQIIKITK